MRRPVDLYIFAVCSFLAVGIGVTLAQVPPEKDSRQLEEQRVKIRQAVQEEDSILGALEDIDRSILDKEKGLDELRNRQAEMEGKAGALEMERQELEAVLANRRVQLQKRLRALYKYSTKGFLQVMLSNGSGSDRLKRVRYLQQIVRNDMALLESHRAAIVRMAEVKKAIEVERLQVKALSLELEAQVTKAQEEKQRKQSLLASIRQEKSMAKRMLREIELAASALTREVEALPAVSFPQNNSVSTNEQAEKNGNEATGKQQEETSVGSAPTRSIEAQRGRLTFPVNDGKVTRAYGRYRAPGMKAYDFHRGLDIVAPAGEPFRAIFAGEVKLAKWFKGYGLLLIVDHGDGYHSIYAHALKLFKKAGDKVSTGEKIGLVGDTGSFQGPYLYLEVRKNGKAVNPLEWIRVPPDALQLQLQ